MKRIYIVITLFYFLAITSSCNKFLDLQPTDQIGQDQALNSKDKIERALNGAYHLLGQGNYYGFEWMNAIWLSSEDVVPFGAGTTDLQFANHSVVASSNTISINWSAMYQVVNQVNNIIEAIHKTTDPDYSAADKGNDLGQALFLRGLVYFDLARTFGGVTASSDLCVPLVLTPTNGLSSKSFPKRNTCAEVYAQVGEDLDSAEALLPLSSDAAVATKHAATALKARLNLYLKNWPTAEQLASAVISDNSYSLVEPYEKLVTQKNSKEAIFELNYSPELTNPLSSVFLPTSLNGSYRIGPSSQLMSLLNNPAIGGDRKVTVATDAEGNPYSNRYRSLVTSGYSDDDVIILRLAEMYLIRAEARANQNELPGALADLNMIRKRSEVAPLLPTLSKEEIIDKILDERRVEFAFEPFRWFDLIRTGRISSALGLTDKNKYVFPLPSNEVQSNPNLRQNTGY